MVLVGRRNTSREVAPKTHIMSFPEAEVAGMVEEQRRSCMHILGNGKGLQECPADLNGEAARPEEGVLQGPSRTVRSGIAVVQVRRWRGVGGNDAPEVSVDSNDG